MEKETIEDGDYWASLIKEFLAKHPDIESAEVVTVFDQDCLKTVSKSSKRIGIHPINKT